MDGHPAPTVMVAPALVGVVVGPGVHTVTFSYGGYGSYAALFALALVVLDRPGHLDHCRKPGATPPARRAGVGMNPADVIPDEDRPPLAAATMSPLAIVGSVLYVIGWAIVAALLVIAFLRLVAWDDFSYFAYADSLALILYLPAWVIGVAAAVTRKWYLLGACLLLVVAQLAFGLPELTAATPVPAAARDAFKFRVLDANVYQKNQSMAGYIAQIRAYHPDLVTMEECPPSDVAQLKGSGALRGLPYVFESSAGGRARSFFIASRYPLGRSTVSSIHESFHGGFPGGFPGGRFPGVSGSGLPGGPGGGFPGGPGGGFGDLPFLIRTTLRLPGITIPLWVVHTSAPTDPSVSDWNEELQKVDQMLQARKPGPLLMVGDFNATWGNRWFRSILDTGLTDAAAARGDPFAMTFSQLFFLLPPIIRIDHVLTNSSLTVTTIDTVQGPGSDHRELQATVAVLPSAYPDHRFRATRAAGSASG